MKVLVTGNAGFVGRYFCKYLHERGHTVYGIDIAFDGEYSNDARDFFREDNTKFDLVIHLAAVVGGRAKIESEPLSVAVDLSIDAELFQWAIRTKPKRLVYFSSSAAYPIELQYLKDKYLLSENDIDLANIKNPDLSYGWSKLTGEMLANYARAEGVKTYIFRPFSGYGSDQDLTYPFPSFIERGLNRRDPFVIWGDGSACRDFVHIEDVINAVFAALDADIDFPVNICTGRATSFTELATMVSKAAKYEPAFEYVLDAPRGVEYRVGNPAKMESFYIPRISLEEGIDRALL
jgi:nucleoside-diphosphate-sugar epimerase